MILRSPNELGGIVQGVVPNINKDTICPADFMIEDLAQFHLLFKSPVTNVPTEISCWPRSPLLVYELWSASSFNSVWSVCGGGIKWGLRWAGGGGKGQALMWRGGTPGVWAIKRFGCVLPCTRWVVRVNICKIKQLPHVDHLGCPPLQPLTLQQNPGGSCFGHDISQDNETAINQEGFWCALASVRVFPAL